MERIQVENGIGIFHFTPSSMARRESQARKVNKKILNNFDSGISILNSAHPKVPNTENLSWNLEGMNFISLSGSYRYFTVHSTSQNAKKIFSMLEFRSGFTMPCALSFWRFWVWIWMLLCRKFSFQLFHQVIFFFFRCGGFRDNAFMKFGHANVVQNSHSSGYLGEG